MPMATASRTPGDTWTARSSDRKSTRLNSSHLGISYAVFCLKKKKHILQYGIEEALVSGIDNLFVVLCIGIYAIIYHFDRTSELERSHQQLHKQSFICEVEST